METRYNEATHNRPLGDRIIDAPLVLIDLKKYDQQLTEENGWKKNDRNSITIYKTDGFTLVLSRLQAGTVLMDNLSGGLITIQVIEGSIDFTVSTGSIHVQELQLITIHPGIMHTIRAVENTLILITSKAM